MRDIILTLYACVLMLLLTAGVSKRVVAPPVFSPDAAPPVSKDLIHTVLARYASALSSVSRTNTRTNLLPDLQVLPPTDLHVVGSREEGTQRLKFTTTIWNAGRGPLEVRSAANPETGELEVYQFARTADGEMTQVGHVGTFDYEHRHGHLHLSTFARYQLWSLDDQGNPLAVIAENHKVGFCLMDIDVIDPERAEGAVYAGCQAEVQGISVGYGDEYVAQLYEQDLDVSDVPDGDYALVNLANPESAIRETSYQNNTATVYLRLEAGRLVS